MMYLLVSSMFCAEDAFSMGVAVILLGELGWEYTDYGYVSCLNVFEKYIWRWSDILFLLICY
jgi:hypothetical protein